MKALADSFSQGGGLFRCWVFGNALICLALSQVFGNGMFSYGEADGFYQQMTYIASLPLSQYEPLHYIHALRLVAVYPFYFLWTMGSPVFLEFLLAYLLALPGVLFFNRGALAYASILIFYFPLFVSLRAFLAALSIVYFFVFIFSDVRGVAKFFLFVLSALWANLSSGVVLSWLALVIFYRGLVVRRSLAPRIILAVAFSGFMVSVAHKARFFSEKSGAGEGFIEEAITRSTVWVSLVDGNYVRALAYFFILLALMVAVFVGPRVRKSGYSAAPFFLAGFPGFFLEGLGVIAYLPVLLLFYLSYIPVFPAHTPRGG